MLVNNISLEFVGRIIKQKKILVVLSISFKAGTHMVLEKFFLFDIVKWIPSVIESETLYEINLTIYKETKTWRIAGTTSTQTDEITFDISSLRYVDWLIYTNHPIKPFPWGVFLNIIQFLYKTVLYFTYFLASFEKNFGSYLILTWMLFIINFN